MRRRLGVVLGGIVLAVVLVTVLVVLVLPRGSSNPLYPDAWPAPAPISWHACSDGDLRSAGGQCATVAVPLDWSHPKDGRTVHLAISRIRHTAKPYDGVMITNPGGPGGSGLDLSLYGAQVPDDVGAHYDWIGIDPRGVGASTPHLTCDKTYQYGDRPDYDTTTAAAQSVWLARAAGYAKACAKYGALLGHMTTRDVATDFDYIRAALGARTASYYGFSYGTHIGAVYATLFPSRIRRMVLDSTVDSTLDEYRANLGQDSPVESNIRAWFAWIAQDDARYHLGSTAAAVEAAYRAEAAKLAAKPADARFGVAELADTVFYAGYWQTTWPGLTTALASLVNDGNAADIEAQWEQLVGPEDDNGYAVYLAVECTDSPWPKAWSRWATDTAKLAVTDPDTAWGNTWYNAPCLTWPAKASAQVRIGSAKAPPILMIDETLDGPTPYTGSIAIRKLFPSARLLAEPGGRSHAETLTGDDCVDETIAGFLGSGKLPPRKAGNGPDATCDPPVQATP